MATNYTYFLGSNNQCIMSLDEANILLGIGISNPSYLLDVNGTSRSLSKIMGTPNNNNYAFQFINSNSEWDIGLPAGTGNYSGDANQGDFVIRCLNGANKLLIQTGAGSSALCMSNNLIGINNSNPRYTIDCSGQIRINSSNNLYNKLLVLYDNGSNDNFVTACNFAGFGVTTSLLKYQVPYNSGHAFYSGTLPTFSINSSGQCFRFFNNFFHLYNL